MQCVAVKNNIAAELFDELKDLTQESSFSVTGMLRAEPRAAGGVEMDVTAAHVYQKVERGTSVSDHAEGAWHRFPDGSTGICGCRSKRQHAAIRVRHEIIKGIRDFFDSNGFTLVDYADFYAGGLRRHDDAVRSGLFRRRKGVSDAIGTAL